MGAQLMISEQILKPLDMQSWPKAQSFYYYTQMAPTTYTVNVNLDVTILRNTLKSKGYKFFPAYLYLVTRTLGRQSDFCISMQEGNLGFWEQLTPMYPQFHEDDKTTSLLWTEYDESFEAFYQNYIVDTAAHGDSHGILSSKGLPPANTYIVSCIPWFSFNSFSLHNHGIKDYFFPSFEAGGFTEVGGIISMPLSVTVHHATIEGYDLKVFFEELQRAMNNPTEWL